MVAPATAGYGLHFKGGTRPMIRRRVRRQRAQTERAGWRHHHSNASRLDPTTQSRNQAPLTVAHWDAPLGERVLLGVVVGLGIFVAGAQCAKAHEPAQLPTGAAWYQAGPAAGWEWKATSWTGEVIELAAYAGPISECWRDATVIEDLAATGWPGGTLQLRAIQADGTASAWSEGKVVAVPEPPDTLALLAGIAGLGGLWSVRSKVDRCDHEDLARACLRANGAGWSTRECGGQPQCDL